MGWTAYSGGHLAEQGVDATSTVTTYNPDGTVASTRPYTAAETAAAEQEAQRNAQIGDLEARVAALEAIVIGTLPAPTTVPTLAALAASQVGALYPGQHVIWTDGQEYVQNAGAPINSNATPSTYPQGWKLAAPPPAAAWVTGHAYAIGDLAGYNGVTYKCIQAHTSQAGWTPPAVPALWSPA